MNLVTGDMFCRCWAWWVVLLTGATANLVAQVIDPPMVASWQSPQLPRALVAEVKAGEVLVEFVVGAKGEVTSAQAIRSSDSRLEEPAVASIRTWTFVPATQDGRPIPFAMRVVVPFGSNAVSLSRLTPPRQPEPLPRQGPRVIQRAPVEHPYILKKRGWGGTVVLELEVQADGLPSNVQVVETPCADFIPAALAAVQLSRFEPARQGGLALPSTIRLPIEFTSIGEIRRTLLESNQLRRADDQPWETLKVPPIPDRFVEPVYPRDELLRGEGGAAEVVFTVTRTGEVTGLSLASATSEAFGRALLAAMRYWTFHPAVGEPGHVDVRVRFTCPFSPPAEDSADPQGRLAARLRRGDDLSAQGLDRRLTPVYRIGPFAPEGQKGVAAEAQVEFLVDREGRARLPQVRSASSPEFGWSAATAVSQWTFERPTRQSEPVDVRVVIPVTYRPPSSDS